MSNAFKNAARFAKASAIFDPAAFEHQQFQQWYKDIPQAAVLGLGAGAAVRGLGGLLGLAKDKLDPPRPAPPAALVANVPFPVAADDDEEEPVKRAGIFAGGHFTDKTNIPGYYPTVLTAGMAGLYGGWKGIDALLEAKKRRDMQQDESEARKGFEQAMLDSYPTPRRQVKMSGEKSAGQELGELLDQLFDMAVKAAEEKNATLDDILGRISGAYLGYAAVTGLGGAALAYNHGMKNSRRSVLEAAMKRRAQQAALTRPAEVYGVPTPVPVHAPGAAEQSEDDAELASLPEQADPVSAPAVPPTAEFTPRRRIGV